MSDPQPPPHLPIRLGWRANPQPGKGKTPGTKTGSWSRKKEDHAQRGIQRYRTKVFFWTSLFVLLLVGFVWWLTTRPVRTPLVLISASNYRHPFPPNAWNAEDVGKLLELEREEILKVTRFDLDQLDADSKKLFEALRQQIKQQAANPGGPSKNLVILYISMHGAVNGANEPCLIPPGVSPLESEKWIRVADFLEQIFPREDTALRAESLKKLIVFDSNRMDCNWGIGLLENSFADGLPSVVKEKAIPGLVLLNSASPGQIGWPAPELGHSVFGYYFAEGIRGEADSDRYGNRDGKVSLQELLKYVQGHVSQWVSEKRAEHQLPILLPADAEFALAFARRHPETAETKPSIPPDPRWDEVSSLWDRHAALKERHLVSTSPEEWEEFQQGLLHLEQLLQAGTAYRDQFEEEKSEMRLLAQSLEQRNPGRNLPAFNFPLAKHFGRSFSSSQEPAFDFPWLKKSDSSPKEIKSDTPPVSVSSPENKASSPENAEKKAEKLPKSGKETAGKEDARSKEPAKALEKTSLRADYALASFSFWNWALNHPWEKHEVVNAIEYLDRSSPRPDVDFVEIEFLRLLVAYLDPPIWQPPSSSLRRAILARNIAEAAASPSDERVFYGIAALVDQGDVARREAEDRLMVGSPEMLREAERSWATADLEPKGFYPAALQRADRLTEAYRWRDRAFSEIPQYVHWIFSPGRSQTASVPALQKSVEASLHLATLLDKETTDSSVAEVSATTQELATHLKILEAAYFKDCSELREQAGQHPQTLSRLMDILNHPFLTGEDRRVLRKMVLELIDRSRRSTEPAGGISTSESPSSLEGISAKIQARKVHPLLHLCESIMEEERGSMGDSSDSRSTRRSAETLAAQGEKIRRFLADTRSVCSKQAAQSLRLLAVVQPAPARMSDIRQPLSIADRRLRLASSLSGRKSVFKDLPQNDPVVLLQKLDRHNLLLWHARRIVDDFWGKEPSGNRMYFVEAASRYLQSAEKLFPEDTAIHDGLIAKLLDSRKNAARKGLIFEKPRDLFVDDQESLIKQNFALSVPTEFPLGTVAVFLTREKNALQPVLSDPDQKEPDSRRMSAVLDRSKSTFHRDFWIPSDEELLSSGQLQLRAYYRGHAGSQEFFIQPASGTEFVYRKPVYPKPTITVRGDTRQTNYLMFIFDCSGSMGEPVSMEGGNTSTRIQVARSTLETILNRLIVPQNPYRIGLRIYGHRLGWNRINQNEVLIRDDKPPHSLIPVPPDFHIPFSNQVHPSDDVELVLPLTPFTQEENALLKEKLDSLVPTGETPLYLAVLQSLDDLASADSHSLRHVIVLTDGENNQSGGDPSLRKTLADLQKALSKPSNRDVKLDVLGFDLPEKESREFKELALEEGRAYYSVTDPASLVRALEKSLGLVQYQVQRKIDGRMMTREPLELNATCEALPNTSEMPVVYLIQLTDRERPAQALATVEGGEALELFVKDDVAQGPRQLVYRRFEKALRDSVTNVFSPENPQQKIFLGAHLPESIQGGAKFYLSVQNADAEQFSPRPAEIWAEIKPMMPDGMPDSPALVFYDRVFESERPVPVLSFLVPKWPTEAKEAEIRFWCRFEKTPPDRQIELSAFQGKALQFEEFSGVAFELEVVPGKQASDPKRIVLIERHSSAEEIPTVKVELDPPPEGITRRWNQKTGTIVHTFSYFSSPPDGKECRVLITRKEIILEKAVASPRPLKVTIPRE